MFETVYYRLVGGNLFVLALAIFLLLSVACEAGFRVGRAQKVRKEQSEATTSAAGVLTAGMLTLLAFTLGLTVSFSQTRYEARRELVVVEANTIGTAWLRARLVGGPEGDAIARLIEDYARTRLEFTRAELDGAADRLINRTGEQQNQIWTLASHLARRAPTPVTASLVAALNDMIDASLSQRFAFDAHAPQYMMLCLLVGSILAMSAMGFQLGLGGVREFGLSSLLLLMWVGGILLTVDLGRPRLGSIRVDVQPLVWTIESFRTPPAAPGP